MDVVFIFHTLILALLVVYAVHMRGRAERLLVLFVLFLFAFHCLFWGPACTLCNLSQPFCLLEVALFWGAVLAYVVYKNVLGK